MAGSGAGVTTPSPPPRNAVQDMAPPGGYAPIDIRRNVPKSVTTRGATGLFLAGGLVMAYGFYRVGTFNVHRRALKNEHKEVRLAIMPLLQAEEDERYVKNKAVHQKWEEGTMKDVPGWNPDPNVYKTRSFMQPFGGSAAYSR